MPDAPVLVTVPNVHLLSVGTWNTSTGKFTATAEDLAAAVAAQDDPAIRAPVVKLGHGDPRFDGEPAVGHIENMRTSEDGLDLYGDLVAVPSWLADCMASAFPSRSIEGYHGWLSSTGAARHQFVVTALALLGTTIPAIESLEDIEALFDGDLVAAAAQQPSAGTPVTVTFEERPMPRPVAASVNLDDVRTEFYETQPPGSWAWVREVWSDFIIVDNDEGDLFRIPWSEEGEGDVTFGTPERVVVQYVPAPADDDATTEGTLTLAARYIPTAGLRAPATNICAARRRTPSLRGPRRTISAGRGQEGDTTMLTPEQRTALGLAEDATTDQIVAALLAAGEYAAAERDALRAEAEEETPAAPAPALPEGVVAIDEAQLEELRVAARSGAEARAQQLADERDRFLTGAVKAGKFPPARLAHFQGLYDRDPDGTREFVEKTLAAGAVPVSEIGTAAGAEGTSDDDAFFARIAPNLVPEAAK